MRARSSFQVAGTSAPTILRWAWVKSPCWDGSAGTEDNGTTASRDFDADGKITQVDNANGASFKTFAYDDAFRITDIVDVGNSALSWTYGYDALDRLSSATSSTETQGWTYDANGNRLTQTGTTPSAYTNAGTSNRTTSISGSLTRSYGYDAAGNTLSYASATFTYNNRGRMATASNGSTTASYTYNALGQRIRRATSSATAIYFYNEAGHLAGEYSSTGALVQETVWLGDTPVATLRPNGSGGVVLYYVHADHLNTPRLVTDTGNNIRWRWDSDAFGTTVPDEDPSSMGVFEYNLRFPGQQYDTVVGLHYNYYRNLDPAIGRYVESDPIGQAGGVNTYGYVGGNPISSRDPLGLDAVPIVFPDYRISTPAGRIGGLGHAGILLIDPNGYTKYYEYGRYPDKNCSCGSVRSPSVPNVKMGKDGRPTPESFKRVLSVISGQSGHGGQISGAYVQNPNFSAMNAEARRRMAQNSNPQREPYDLTDNSCITFVQDILEAGGVDTPWMIDPRPNSYINELRDDYPHVNYRP